MSQTTFSAAMALSYAGLIADLDDSLILSRTNGEASTHIPYGCGVIRDPSYLETCAILPSTTYGIQNFLGVSVRTQTELGQVYPYNSTSDVPEDGTFGVIKRGTVYVKVEDSPVAGDQAYVRIASGTGTQIGAFYTSSDSGTCLPLPGVYFTGAVSNGVAPIYMHGAEGQDDSFRTETYLANADLRNYQFHAVKLTNAAGTAKLALAGDGEAAIGILLNAPNTGAKGVVCVSGKCPAYVGAAGFTAGDALASDASGHVVTGTANEVVIGRATVTGTTTQVKVIDVAVPASTIVQGHKVINRWYKVMSTIADGDLLTDWTPGFAGTIDEIWWEQEVVASTPAKTTAIHCEIGAVATTGGVLTLTTAASATKGVLTLGTAITGANAFSAVETISILAATTTAFIEGTGYLCVRMTQTA